MGSDYALCRRALPVLGQRRLATGRLEVSPGLRPIGAYAPEGTTEETSARAFSLTHKCKLAVEKNLKEWFTHFWGNLLFGEVLTDSPDRVKVVCKRRGTISKTSQSNIQAQIPSEFHAAKAQRGQWVVCLQNYHRVSAGGMSHGIGGNPLSPSWHAMCLLVYTFLGDLESRVGDG